MLAGKKLISKKRQSPRLAPPTIGKRLSVWPSEYDSNTKKIMGGGPVQANLGGASPETFSGEAQLKKITLYICEEKDLLFKVAKRKIHK